MCAVLLLVCGSGICWQWVAVQEKQAGSLVGNLSHNIEGKKNSVHLMLRVEDADVHFLISINIETLPPLS